MEKRILPNPPQRRTHGIYGVLGEWGIDSVRIQYRTAILIESMTVMETILEIQNPFDEKDAPRSRLPPWDWLFRTHHTLHPI